MSVFTKIISGELPSYKIHEDQLTFSFLALDQVNLGHTLVIPKKEVDYLFDLDDATYLELMSFSKQVALAIKKTIPCNRVGVAVIGLEVPHAHVHLIPINTDNDMNFANAKLQLSKSEFLEIALAISKNI